MKKLPLPKKKLSATQVDKIKMPLFIGAFLSKRTEHMKTLDLIELLQKLVAEHKSYEDVMGPHEIVIDVFGKTADGKYFEYKGFSPNFKIEKSSDGVYDILSAFEDQK